jgi:hypothetical protein
MKKGNRVFSLSQKKNKSRLIGSNFPEWVYLYLALYSTAKGITRTKILYDLMNNWINTVREQETEEGLLLQIADQARKSWRLQKKINPDLPFPVFKSRMRDELESKHIPNAYIMWILNRLEE